MRGFNVCTRLIVIALAMSITAVIIEGKSLASGHSVPAIEVNQSSSIDNITYLMGAAGTRSAGIELADYNQPKHAWLTKIQAGTYVEWTIRTEVSEAFHVSALINPGAESSSYVLSVNGSDDVLEFTIPHNGWQRFEAGEIELPNGVSTIRLERTSEAGSGNLKSLEIMPLREREAYLSRVEGFHSDVSGFAGHRYGLMFQYGPWGFPKSGPPKTDDDQTNDFNVPAFVEMVKSTGADYVIWSVTWWEYELSAPIEAIDNIVGHSDFTTDRDLLGEIGEALKAEGIGYYFYYHPGHDAHAGYNTTEWWQAQNWPDEFKDTGTGDRSVWMANWIDVISAIGTRYGDLLDGWFFDAGFIYYPAPFEAFGAAAKAGNPDRLVSYNPWIVTNYTQFADVSFGEACPSDQAPVEASIGGNGVYLSGRDRGLQGHCMHRMEGDWGIYDENQSFGEHNYTPETAITLVRDHISRKVPVSFNLMMYEDGSVSDQSLSVLRAVKDAIGSEGGS